MPYSVVARVILTHLYYCGFYLSSLRVQSGMFKFILCSPPNWLWISVCRPESYTCSRYGCSGPVGFWSELGSFLCEWRPHLVKANCSSHSWGYCRHRAGVRDPSPGSLATISSLQDFPWSNRKILARDFAWTGIEHWYLFYWFRPCLRVSVCNLSCVSVC